MAVCTSALRAYITAEGAIGIAVTRAAIAFHPMLRTVEEVRDGDATTFILEAGGDQDGELLGAVYEVVNYVNQEVKTS